MARRRGQPEKVDHNAIGTILAQAGLQLVKQRELDIRVSVDDWKRFYAIDSFAIMSLPHLPVDLAKDVLERAMCRLEEIPLPNVKWYIYRATL